MGVLDSRPPWISATLWTWGRWPRTSRWICLSTSSGKKSTLDVITKTFFTICQVWHQGWAQREVSTWERRQGPLSHTHIQIRRHGEDHNYDDDNGGDDDDDDHDGEENNGGDSDDHDNDVSPSFGPLTSTSRTWRICGAQATSTISWNQSRCELETTNTKTSDTVFCWLLNHGFF